MNIILNFLIQELNNAPELSETYKYGNVYYPYSDISHLFNGILLYAKKKCFRTNKLNARDNNKLICIDYTKIGSCICECIDSMYDYIDCLSYTYDNGLNDEQDDIIFNISYMYHVLINNLTCINSFWNDINTKTYMAQLIAYSINEYVEKDINEMVNLLIDERMYENYDLFNIF